MIADFAHLAVSVFVCPSIHLFVRLSSPSVCGSVGLCLFKIFLGVVSFTCSSHAMLTPCIEPLRLVGDDVLSAREFGGGLWMQIGSGDSFMMSTCPFFKLGGEGLGP